MNGELRALGLANGLLLGLVLASPMVAPDMMLRGVEALFIIGAFQLRLTDRRLALRDGWRGWVSHIRMAPLRLVPWAAMAIVGLIGRDAGDAMAIVAAAMLGEFLIYPLGSRLLERLSRPALAAMLLLIVALASVSGDMMRMALAFLAGMTACLFWLRGPDGEPLALGGALAGAASMMAGAAMLPQMLPFAFPAGVVCATAALAHLSVLRRRPTAWRWDDGASWLDQGIRRRPARLAPPPA